MIAIPKWDSDFFQPEELLSPDSIKLWEEKGLCILDPIALSTLNEFRAWLSMPLIVNSGDLRLRGTRSERENSMIDGSAVNSLHKYGKAFDITCPNLTPAELLHKAIEFKKWSGIGVYRSWVHVDIGWRRGLTTWDLRP